MMFDVEFEDGKTEKVESRREYLARIRYDEIVLKRANDFEAMTQGGIKPDTQYRIVTNNSINAISIVEYLIRKYVISETYIAIYRMNLQAVRRIKEVVQTGIPCKILLSSFFRENKKYERWTREIEQFGRAENECIVGFAWSHAKVFLAKTECGKHIVFEGSGNLSDNARIEQYLLEDNRQAYDFHAGWIDEILSNG